MKRAKFIFLLVFLLVMAANVVNAQYSCDSGSCSVPICVCGSTLAPGGFTHEETPQFIMITFDDAVNVVTEDYLSALHDGMVNKDGGTVPFTYFVQQLWSDSTLINELYMNGHELASHTATHTTNSSTTYQTWRSELQELNNYLVNMCGVNSNQITGFRAPMLATNEDMYLALHEMGFLYQSSLTEKVSDPPIVSTGQDSLVYPYTFDYGAATYCLSAYCPQNTYPGLWDIPMWTMEGEDGVDYGSMDPSVVSDTKFDSLLHYVFEQRYDGNRAPMGIYLHAGQINSAGRQAVLTNFINEVVQQPGVWAITMRGLIEWMRDPVPASQLSDWFANDCDRGKCRDSSGVTAPDTIRLTAPADGYQSPNTMIDLQWDVQLQTDQYHMQIAEDPDFNTVSFERSDLQKTSFHFVNLGTVGRYYWRVRSANKGGWGEWSQPRAFDIQIPNSVKNEDLNPVKFSLEQNFPNPFNPSTVIYYSIAEPGMVQLTVYNVLGKQIAELSRGFHQPGSYKVSFNAEDIASGLYIYRLKSGSAQIQRKMLLLK